MADLSKVTLPSGNTYDLKDATARQEINTIKDLTSSGVTYAGTTTTVLTDGSTVTSVVIKDGSTTKTLSATEGMMVNYNNVMFAWNGSQWDQLGSDSALKALAYKDSVSGDVTPEGTVSAPTFTGEASTVTVDVTPEGSVDITPTKGTVSAVTNVGTLPELKMSVTNETLTFSWDAGTLPTKGDLEVVTGATATFTGTKKSASGTVTPKGTVSQPTFAGTKVTVESK